MLSPKTIRGGGMFNINIQDFKVLVVYGVSILAQ